MATDTAMQKTEQSIVEAERTREGATQRRSPFRRPAFASAVRITI